MKIGDLDTGRELTPAELTKWLIQRTRFLLDRDIPDRKPGEYQQSEFANSLERYVSEEQRLLQQMKEQIALRDQQIERLRQDLYNATMMMASTEARLGEQIQECNELRSRILALSSDMGDAAETA